MDTYYSPEQQKKYGVVGIEFEVVKKIDISDEIKSIKKILESSSHAVFFGGAGMSTESGIPDFRGNAGLYTREGESNEYYLSRGCLENEPDRFFEFFRKNMLFRNAEPNRGHKALAKLEERGIIKSVITQNVDGLHQKAGSKRVIELHGSADRYYCTVCRKFFDAEIMLTQDNVPCCNECGALVRPDVTLYGEALDGFNYMDAEDEVSKADVLIVGGSSLLVNPAASLIDMYSGEHLIIINYLQTPCDVYAELVIRASLSDVLTALSEK
ncbi:MAG: NAD-dependent protein deacylase [Clostridia bacterium]|nr:NAD-dependent protein deacylase [Clostridia bacterium]